MSAARRQIVRMKALAPLTLVLALSGCVKPDANIYRGGVVGQKVIGNEISVTVSNVWNAGDAFGLAEQHCRQFSRAARPSGGRGYTFSFDCVAP